VCNLSCGRLRYIMYVLHVPVSCYQEIELAVQSLLWEIAMRHVCAAHINLLLSGD
jgi:hypothetical protein